MNANAVVSIVVLILSAIAFGLMQVVGKYPEYSVEIGAVASVLMFVANKLPAAFERTPATPDGSP